MYFFIFNNAQMHSVKLTEFMYCSTRKGVQVELKFNCIVEKLLTSRKSTNYLRKFIRSTFLIGVLLERVKCLRLGGGSRRSVNLLVVGWMVRWWSRVTVRRQTYVLCVVECTGYMDQNQVIFIKNQHYEFGTVSVSLQIGIHVHKLKSFDEIFQENCEMVQLSVPCCIKAAQN